MIMLHSCSFSIIHGNQFQYLTFIPDLTELWFNINQVISKLSVTHGDIILTRWSLLAAQKMDQVNEFEIGMTDVNKSYVHSM